MSTYKVTDLTNHKKEFQTEKMKVPAVLHVSEPLLPSDETLWQLENLAQDGRVFHHLAALSDIHPKKGRKIPTGTVVASQTTLLPQINDTAPNCGMRFLRTDLNEENLPPEKIEALFQELVKVIPTKKLIGTKIPFALALEVLKSGLAPLREKMNFRTLNELENTYKQGNFFGEEKLVNREILDVIPKLFIEIGKYRLGILGAAGNHFLDLMKITDIVDPEKAAAFGLKQGQYAFLMHTGSGLLGQYASYMYTPKTKEHLSQQIVLKLGTTFFPSQYKRIYQRLALKVKEYATKDEFLGFEESDFEGKMFIRAHRAAANFGFANRSMLTHHLDQALEKVLGRLVPLNLLYDTPHLSVEKENHFGQDVWVHRNGTVRANGPARMAGHPLFSQTGEPVFIPSSMTTPAYIGVGTDENESTFFSASHGTGRRRDAEHNAPHSKQALFQKAQAQKVKIYNAKSKGVVMQDSAYYKDVEEVISGMVDNKIVKVVAKMQPVAVLMY